ncbi:hypothetical protein M0813_22485 [Anaeramoeba flamelloides]|uniref:C2H2-type domain-containing protein n=1 Tax=Anaeramoeba flamelloides TaxID=1746091 RepID=A0ABQ8YCN5_9EUKA|nr:hypothetical protein M0813_22485 [Anaeramoeba flamelloides]
MQEKREYINGNYQKCPKCSKLNRFYGIGCGFIHCGCGKIYCKYCLKEFGTEFEAFAHYRLEHRGTNETIVTQDLDEICSSVELITIEVHRSKIKQNFTFLKCDTLKTLRMMTQHNPNVRFRQYGSWYFENQCLENEEATLESLGIQNNSTLEFYRIMRKMKPGTDYRINTLDGETASCRFDKIKTCRKLIKRYKKKKRNRKNLKLIHEGEILKGRERLDKYPFSKHKPFYLITKEQFKEL